MKILIKDSNESVPYLLSQFVGPRRPILPLRCRDGGRTWLMPYLSAAVGRWFYRPSGAPRLGCPKPVLSIVAVSRRRKSVDHWPLAINILTQSGARSQAGSRL